MYNEETMPKERTEEISISQVYEEYGVVIIDDIESFKQHHNGEQELKEIWAFLLVKSGTLKLKVNEKDISLSKNDMFFYTRNHFINNIEGSDDFHGAAMIVNGRLAAEMIHSNVDMMRNLFYIGENPILHLSDNLMQQYHRYFELIRFKWLNRKSNSLYNSEIIHSIARAMLYEWANVVNHNIPSDNENRALKQGERLFKNFIYELTNDEVKSRSVTEYANRLCVTPKYLSAVCKQVTGKTASAYINFYMVKDIKQLLKYSDKSIKEIAQTLGFPNLSFFGKYVKAHLGVSPSAYRKKRD